MELLTLTPQGLYCELGDFYIDPWEKVDTALITHAHGDHARPGMGHYLAVPQSVGILRKRLGEDIRITTREYGEKFSMGQVQVSLHPAGHILGSCQVRVEHAGEVWVFTGDFKLDEDPTCAPFEPVVCDVFISEATFSLPVYQWQNFKSTIREIREWWVQNAEAGQNSVLCCYSLGKAQRLIAGLREVTDDPIYVHGSVDELNRCYEEAGMSWPSVFKVPLGKEKLKSEVIICPPAAIGSSWAKRLAPAQVAFASGWMRVRGNRRRKGYDRGFVISDHADWPSLLRAIEETKCKRAYFTHGQTESIVRYLREKGIDARDLKMPFETEGET